MGVFHSTVVVVPDDPSSPVGTDEWNAGHVDENGNPVSVPTKVTADRTYYVRTDGDNSNNGLTNTAGGAFRTIQYAVDFVRENLYIHGCYITIQVGDGTYDEYVELRNWSGNAPLDDTAVGITIAGNSGDRTQVAIKPTTDGKYGVISQTGSSEWTVQDLTVDLSSIPSGLHTPVMIEGQAVFQTIGCKFIMSDFPSNFVFESYYGSTCGIFGAIIDGTNIAGVATAADASYLILHSINLVQDIAPTDATVVGQLASEIVTRSTTWSGHAVTGQRFRLVDSSRITSIFGAQPTPTSIPGSIAGTIGTGASYVGVPSVTVFDGGTVSSGTFTPNYLNGSYQYYTNNGAHTLAAPVNDCDLDILITNGASAGAITFSGFTVGPNTGDALTTTNTNKFIIHIRRINGISAYFKQALQ